LYRETILPIVRARIAASIGDADAASTLLERATVPGREGLIAATCDALGLPRPDPHPEPNPTHPYVRVMEYLKEADHAFTRHDYDRTWPALEHALGLVERNSFCRAFVDSGLRVRPLLQTYIAQARPLGQVAGNSSSASLPRRPTATRPSSSHSPSASSPCSGISRR
jgi:hypothetical protein